ncbi:lipoprotein [Planctomycetia bacterium]|nr:lipoprotein [Planctomycetia bacterium]
MPRSLIWNLLAVSLGLLVGPVLLRADGLQYPLTAVASADGKSLFIADLDGSGVWKLSDGKLSMFFQASKKFRTPLNRVRCIGLDRNGKLLAGDSATREIFRFDDEGKPQPLTNGGIGIPMDLVVDPDNNIFVTDLELKWIWKIPAAGGKAEKFAEVEAPRGITIDADRNLWVINHGKNQLLRVTPDAKVEVVVEGRPWGFPHEVELDKDKTAFVTDGYGKCVWKVPLGGKPEKLASGEPLVNPVGLTWQGETLLVIDPRAKGMFAIDSTGKLAAVPASAEK